MKSANVLDVYLLDRNEEKHLHFESESIKRTLMV